MSANDASLPDGWTVLTLPPMSPFPSFASLPLRAFALNSNHTVSGQIHSPQHHFASLAQTQSPLVISTEGVLLEVITTMPPSSFSFQPTE
jgi:hypothetical protein